MDSEEHSLVEKLLKSIDKHSEAITIMASTQSKNIKHLSDMQSEINELQRKRGTSEFLYMWLILLTVAIVIIVLKLA